MNKSRPHLLLVDDEASIREPLGKYLERQGFRVTDVASAATARSALLSYDMKMATKWCSMAILKKIPIRRR